MAYPDISANEEEVIIRWPFCVISVGRQGAGYSFRAGRGQDWLPGSFDMQTQPQEAASEIKSYIAIVD